MLICFSRSSWLLQPHRPQSTRDPLSMDFPGRNTGVGNHFLLKESPNSRTKPVFPHLCTAGWCLPAEPSRKPINQESPFFIHFICSVKMRLNYPLVHLTPFGTSLSSFQRFTWRSECCQSAMFLHSLSKPHLLLCILQEEDGEPQLDQSQCPALIWVELTTA